jgi:uncharacterized protein with PIN domain
MGYEIPKEEEVSEIITKILERRGVIESQAELHREVMKHLKRRNKDYKLSERRMRIIALSNKSVALEIRYKLTDKVVEDMEKCPVCGGNMARIENSTLDGKKVIIGFKCTSCPYWTGKKLRVPIRYIFRYKP